jgi:hypothetical protein
MAASDPIGTDWVTGFIITSLQRASSVPNRRSLQAVLSRRAIRTPILQALHIPQHKRHGPILARTSALYRMKARAMAAHHLVILQQGS